MRGQQRIDRDESFLPAEIWQLDHFENDGKEDEGDAEAPIRDFHGINAAGAGVELLRPEKQDATDARCDHVAQRIEALREIEAGRRGFLRPEDSDVRAISYETVGINACAASIPPPVRDGSGHHGTGAFRQDILPPMTA